MHQSPLKNFVDRKDVARWLEVDYKLFTYRLYKLMYNTKNKKEVGYNEFGIKRRGGGERRISTPKYAFIKHWQKKVSEELNSYYKPIKGVTFGFVKKGSVLKNAQRHLRPKFLFNTDIEDFFGSVPSGKVCGFFQRAFVMEREAAEVLTQICCYEGRLPQGGVTSPILSNILVRPLDKKISKWATNSGYIYTRYADDISISGKQDWLPEEREEHAKEIRKKVESYLKEAGFRINNKKTRFSYPTNRQVVAGVIVNNEKANLSRKYIKQVMTMLYQWNRDGLKVAWDKHIKTHNNDQSGDGHLGKYALETMRDPAYSLKLLLSAIHVSLVMLRIQEDLKDVDVREEL